MDRIIDQATKQFESGLENDSYFGKTIDRYQPRWLPFADLAAQPEFRKRQPIAVIGDKKAGGNIGTYLEAPDATLGFLRSVKRLKLIQICRDPVDAARSFERSHGVPFREGAEQIVHRSKVAFDLGTGWGNDFLMVYYEDRVTRTSRRPRRGSRMARRRAK